jgi:hypothetical protein
VTEQAEDVAVVDDGEPPITEEDALGYTAAAGTLEHSEGELVSQVEGRCEAETTVGGTLYRCGLEVLHEGDHAFTPVEDEEPPADDSEKRMRQANDRLNRENERHWNRIVEIMGSDSTALVPCELCFPLTPGFRWDSAPNEETAAKVRVAIGLPDVSNFAPSATERTCDDCRGLGKVRTGSSVPGQETGKCDACAGKGFVATRPRMNTDTAAPAAPDDPSNGIAYLDDGVERDMFGTPKGDPDFNLMPNVRARPVDYWQTNRV